MTTVRLFMASLQQFGCLWHHDNSSAVYGIVTTVRLNNCLAESGDFEQHESSWITNSLKPSGQYMYHQFIIHISYVLPTQRIYVFCVDLRTHRDYFPRQH
jgi:hypothetical protein